MAIKHAPRSQNMLSFMVMNRKAGHARKKIFLSGATGIFFSSPQVNAIKSLF